MHSLDSYPSIELIKCHTLSQSPITLVSFVIISVRVNTFETVVNARLGDIAFEMVINVCQCDIGISINNYLTLDVSTQNLLLISQKSRSNHIIAPELCSHTMWLVSLKARIDRA